MSYKERLGATSDSLRIKNNEWFVARSVTQEYDVKVFKVNLLDQIEFFTVPSVNGDSFVLQSQFDALELRVAILEAIVASLSSGNAEIYAYTLTPTNIANKTIILPTAPLPSTTIIIPERGIAQLADVDFSVTGFVIDFNGMPYEAVAEAGDVVKIIYLTAVV